MTGRAAVALARERGCALLLIGRTPLRPEPPELAGLAGEREVRAALAVNGATPARIAAAADGVLANREIEATLAELATHGVRARYLAADVRDRAAVDAALVTARAEFGGPVTGLVHGAGVLADGLLSGKPDDGFERVFATKVDGLRVLLDALAGEPLDLLCTFSSVAARYGNAGQTGYAMANEVISQVVCAVAAGRPDCRAVTIDWGPWDGGMVDAALRARFRAGGTDVIGLEDGAAAFVAELTDPAGPPRVGLVAGTMPGADPGPRAAGSILVGHRVMPFLADHVVAGVPVLPLALSLEWITRVVRDRQPGPVALRDVTVRRRIDLPDLDGDGHLLAVTVEEGPHGLAVALCDSTGRACHAATAVEAAVGPPAVASIPADAPGSGAPFDYLSPALFHGPAFQAISEVVELTPDGARARVRGTAELGWPGTWTTDPAACDAAIQLALLWAEHVEGAAYLPMAVDEVRIADEGGAAVAALVSAVQADASTACCDVAVVDAAGRVLAELLGLRLVVRPQPVPVGARR